MIKTDVLVVGCGPAGLTAASALAKQGVRVCAISKHGSLAPTPRAHVTNQRTFEIFRDLGVEDQALHLATPYESMPNQIFLRSLVGLEYGRLRGLVVNDSRNSEASPCRLADLPQNLLEPILFKCAVSNGATVRFNTELRSFTQEPDGVTALLDDHLTGESIEVEARYMIGADGGRSRVAEAIKLPFEGPGKLGESINTLFEADLTAYVAHRPGLLYFMVRTAGDHGGAGLGILRCVRPWTSWLMIKGYAPGQEAPDLSHEEAVDVVRDYLGVPDLQVTITGVDPWDLNSLSAATYQNGRIFCMGDAVPRHAPSNGLGSNTAIQDAYNLAWKLALVLKGKAGAPLLETYSEERVPIGRQAVERATKSMGTYTAVLDAIRVLDERPSESLPQAPPGFVADIEAGRNRRALQSSIREKIYEFQARGVELNQYYSSSAVVSDGTEVPAASADPELFYSSTAMPGARLPHAWVQRDGRDLSTLDLVGKGRFTLLTGLGGEGWISAADAVASAHGFEIPAIAIGSGCSIEDLYFEWAERREISEDGCILVRPDGYIAWRCHTRIDGDAGEKLAKIVEGILGIAR